MIGAADMHGITKHREMKRVESRRMKRDLNAVCDFRLCMNDKIILNSGGDKIDE